ncbi:Phenylpyruvate decarboxylase [Komagataella phaffii CBS 7435]|uniref:Phenylpyruvate decarboxylase, catalyzes decarboxylation of phenylpyruvate to phenylacetaldehyde n=2 Tax=Komagataella phaffii TaxID=460519 RepID=C4R7I0_KOMPG|nr:Phenylpyruvate decarboxylase, catalyzes decarboxylation of phenylpyruvate to phenylacetaldehyde [Komagataella phaffii GS115]AOA65026.1 GQ67_04650T0 [Komagataella phaffii]CAH2451071.1 Phenylpyruvate decarboxylase [Komagataella phaffii CBS 7435]AOA69441.1 GQ68_04622T0 [Komagataella phaffii GS115]CAY71555.1 Phenylpyruvate decarboxylase, catalyzes decarboxylation of phenylpyruvate to phenylacetaldehyde [Komagataella phaffii GS115]CCA40839.1 Phenylpyruvate decarboxylase [Komagataella phaffii CBS
MAPVKQDFNIDVQTIENTDISLSEYIYLRIAQLGVKSIFGVPGDFNLNLVDELDKVPQLKWIGCCNELNATYAADGYAKASGTIGVVVTTYGVGELSAINGIAGAFAEYAPVLHIVGTSAMATKRLEHVHNIHHLAGSKNFLDRPDHYIYEKMVDDICIVKESLSEIENACGQIDNAIVQTYLLSRPGYLFLPRNMATMKVPRERLFNQPLALERVDLHPGETLQVVEKILEKFYHAKEPALIVDYLTRPFRMMENCSKLIGALENKVNIFSRPMSKGFVDESHPRYIGCYIGKQSKHPSTSDILEKKSDFILSVGTFDVETNNGGFTSKLPQEHLVELNPHFTRVGTQCFSNVNMCHVLPLLASKLRGDLISMATVHPNDFSLRKKEKAQDKMKALNQSHLVKSTELLLNANDTLIVETCSFMFAVPDIAFPNNTQFISQSFYNSIGYALPATLGVSIAKRDFRKPGKVVLIQGDGSAQMTIQELATMVRQKVKPTILLLNNEGYTVERMILGPTKEYNDIAPNWDWTGMLRAFGDIRGHSKSISIDTCGRLDKLVQTREFQEPTHLNFVELILGRMDAPERFANMVKEIANLEHASKSIH